MKDLLYAMLCVCVGHFLKSGQMTKSYIYFNFWKFFFFNYQVDIPLMYPYILDYSSIELFEQFFTTKKKCGVGSPLGNFFKRIKNHIFSGNRLHYTQIKFFLQGLKTSCKNFRDCIMYMKSTFSQVGKLYGTVTVHKNVYYL